MVRIAYWVSHIAGGRVDGSEFWVDGDQGDG